MRGVRRFELVVVAAVLVSTPSLIQAFDGGITVTSAMIRLAVALAVSWAVGAIVEGTIDNYARQVRQRELAARIERLRNGGDLGHDRGYDLGHDPNATYAAERPRSPD